MKRGGPLRRDTPKSKAWANAPRKRIPPRSAKVIADLPRRAVERAAVLAPGAVCVLRGVSGAGTCFGPLTPHHRRKAGQGGAYDRTNLVAMCAHHNDRLEADADLAALARDLGLVIRAGGGQHRPQPMEGRDQKHAHGRPSTLLVLAPVKGGRR